MNSSYAEFSSVSAGYMNGFGRRTDVIGNIGRSSSDSPFLCRSIIIKWLSNGGKGMASGTTFRGSGFLTMFKYLCSSARGTSCQSSLNVAVSGTSPKSWLRNICLTIAILGTMRSKSACNNNTPQVKQPNSYCNNYYYCQISFHFNNHLLIFTAD